MNTTSTSVIELLCISLYGWGYGNCTSARYRLYSAVPTEVRRCLNTKLLVSGRQQYQTYQSIRRTTRVSNKIITLHATVEKPYMEG